MKEDHISMNGALITRIERNVEMFSLGDIPQKHCI